MAGSSDAALLFFAVGASAAGWVWHLACMQGHNDHKEQSAQAQHKLAGAAEVG